MHENEILEIFLITYNRKTYLKKTLEKIFSKNSPLKKYSITIFDNNSNDGTEDLCKDFESRFANLNYVKNKRNVGLSGNICKAMEHASKKYYWIICDNDEIDFTSWPEIEYAMKKDYDLIMGCVDYKCKNTKDEKIFALAQSTFLPACIYKTSFLTDDIMVYSMTDIHTILPHVCMACNIINNNGRIYIPQKSIITLTSNVKIENIKQYNYDRCASIGTNKLLHERTKYFSFHAGICAAFNALKDKKLQKRVIKTFTNANLLNNYGPFLPITLLYANQYKPFNKNKMPKHIWKQFVDLIPLEEKLKSWIELIIPIRFYFNKNDLCFATFFCLIRGKLIPNFLKIKHFIPSLVNVND